MFMVGMNLYMLKKYDTALEVINNISWIIHGMETSKYSQCMMFLGRIYHALGKDRLAESSYTESIGLYRSLNDDVNVAIVLICRAAAHMSMSECRSSARDAVQSLDLLEEYVSAKSSPSEEFRYYSVREKREQLIVNFVVTRAMEALQLAQIGLNHISHSLVTLEKMVSFKDSNPSSRSVLNEFSPSKISKETILKTLMLLQEPVFIYNVIQRNEDRDNMLVCYCCTQRPSGQMKIDCRVLALHSRGITDLPEWIAKLSADLLTPDASPPLQDDLSIFPQHTSSSSLVSAASYSLCFGFYFVLYIILSLFFPKEFLFNLVIPRRHTRELESCLSEEDYAYTVEIIVDDECEREHVLVPKSSLRPHGVDVMRTLRKRHSKTPYNNFMRSDVASLHASRELYNMIFAPFQSFLRDIEDDSLITVITSSCIASVPFAGMMGPDGKYVVERFRIRHLSSLSVFSMLHDPIRQQFAVQSVARHQKEKSMMPRLWKQVSLLCKSRFTCHPNLPLVEEEVNHIPIMNTSICLMLSGLLII